MTSELTNFLPIPFYLECRGWVKKSAKPHFLFHFWFLVLHFALFSFASFLFPHPLSCVSLREGKSHSKVFNLHTSRPPEKPHPLHLFLCVFFFSFSSSISCFIKWSASIMLLLIKDFHGWGGHHLGYKHTSARPAPLCWLFSGLAAELSSLWAAHVQMLRQGRPSWVGRGPRVFVRTSASHEHHSPRDERRSAGPSLPHSPAMLQSECWLTLSCVQAWELSPTSPPHSLAFCHWKDQLLERALELSVSCSREVSVPRALITKNRNFRGFKRYCIPSVSIEKQQEKSVDCS